MKIASAQEMREIDRRTIEEYGICSLVLMERAGLNVAEKAREITKPQKTIVLCGAGNNGGDGLVAARLLKNLDWNVKAFFLGSETKASEDCKTQLRLARKFGVPVVSMHPDDKDLHAALVIDAIFGTGLSKPITGRLAETIKLVNASGNTVIAVDISSGISSDTGEVMGAAVEADYTVTFGLPKAGHFLFPGPASAGHTGKLTISDIGFPQELLKQDSLKLELPEREDMAMLVPERPSHSYKNTYGHVLSVCGSTGKTGAAMLCARAVLRTGAGLVTTGMPEELLSVYETLVLDEMTLPLPSKGGGLSAQASGAILDFMHGRGDVLAMGPGIGHTPDTQKIMAELISKCASPMVLDADALNSLKGNYKLLQKAKAPIVLTPHPGEMGRLLDVSAPDVEKDRIGKALFLAKESGACVVLKGVPTVIASPEGNAYLNPTGSPAMAKAGMGDVLTGMIAALMAQGLPPLDAALLGVYAHGLAGELAAAEKGVHSVLASDLHDTIGRAINDLLEVSSQDVHD